MQRCTGILSPKILATSLLIRVLNGGSPGFIGHFPASFRPVGDYCFLFNLSR
ncbi:MAG: hypothetical protein RL091_1308 [Verrucomicrobiota bacterium]|jgi:hypothetical protein